MWPSNRPSSVLASRPFTLQTCPTSNPPSFTPALAIFQSFASCFIIDHLHIILALKQRSSLTQMHPVHSLEPAYLRPDASTHSGSSIMMTHSKDRPSSHPDSSDNNSSSGRQSMSIRVVRSAPSLLTLDDYNLISLGYKPASPPADIVFLILVLLLQYI